ncbi:MAG TPA: hypothetical protein VIV09_05115 [Pseudolabrys sp.]
MLKMFGIGMGPDSNEKQAYGGLKTLSGFSSSHGQNDITSAEDFWRGIMSGDPTKINAILAPQIKGIRERGQQQIQTASQFGDRSGGTNAGLQMVQDKTASAINEMIDELTGKGAEVMGNLGLGLTGQGMSGYGQLFKEAQVMHDQNAAKWGDIFKSISDVATGAMGGAGL